MRRSEERTQLWEDLIIGPSDPTPNTKNKAKTITKTKNHSTKAGAVGFSDWPLDDLFSDQTDTRKLPPEGLGKISSAPVQFLRSISA